MRIYRILHRGAPPHVRIVSGWCQLVYMESTLVRSVCGTPVEQIPDVRILIEQDLRVVIAFPVKPEVDPREFVMVAA